MWSAMTLTFRRISRSGALEAHARELGSRLQRFGERIVQCHMTLEGPVADDNKGTYLVKIDLAVPGAQIHADSLRSDGAEPLDIYRAMRNAFENAGQQLQELHSNRVMSVSPPETLGATLASPKP
jgi:Sigma 54 modulation protein / S30EA ribosomal protein